MKPPEVPEAQVANVKQNTSRHVRGFAAPRRPPLACPVLRCPFQLVDRSVRAPRRVRAEDGKSEDRSRGTNHPG